MNTIKIYLAESGALAQLQKDFPLYQYQFNNKLLNIFVPTSICAGNFVDENISEGYACQVKMDYMDSQNKQHRTGAFYCRYVKTLTQNGVEYALFERTLPYAFTLYAGQGVGAPTLTVTIVNVAEHDGAPAVISTISSQECALDVLDSTPVADIDEPIDPDIVTELEAKMTTIISQLALKQNADTTNDGVGNVINQDGIDHTVVGNINDLLGRTKTAEDDIDTLQGEMTQAQIDIADLQRVIGTGIDFVGVMRWNADIELTPLPTDADVEAFVLRETGEQPRAAQAVIVEVAKTSEPDEVYIYTYDGSTWRHYAIQFMNKAQNGNEGVIEGDYTIGGLSTYDNFMVSIVNGKIINIYRVDANGNDIDFKTMADQVIAKLVGNTPVNRATADKNGNDIYNTYQTKQEGASKDYVQDYASPKALYDINYSNYALGKFEKVNVADNSYNKTITSAQIGDTLLGTINLTLDSDILLGDQNGLQQKIWLSSTRTEGVKLRLEAYYQHNGGQTYSLLGTPTLTDTISLVANTPTLVTIENLFDNLSTPVTVESGMNISIMLYVWREDSTSADFTLLSNTTYPAYMELNKIGFVRYSLEAEPDAIVSGHDSTPTIDSDGDLLVSSTDGEINYKNGNSAPLTTILKIPMDNGLNDPTSVLPARAGQVVGALANYVDKTTAQTISGNKTFSNQTYFNGAIGNSSDGIVRFAADIRPITNAGSDLGVSNGKWRDLYLSRNLSDGTNSISVANIQPKVVVDTTSTSPITLTNGKSFRLGTISALTINNPSSYALDFECEIIFTADSTISMTYSAVAPTWSGDDVAGGVFTPQANKTYNILFFNNATAVATPSIQAIVRGV